MSAVSRRFDDKAAAEKLQALCCENMQAEGCQPHSRFHYPANTGLNTGALGYVRFAGAVA